MKEHCSRIYQVRVPKSSVSCNIYLAVTKLAHSAIYSCLGHVSTKFDVYMAVRF